MSWDGNFSVDSFVHIHYSPSQLIKPPIIFDGDPMDRPMHFYTLYVIIH